MSWSLQPITTPSFAAGTELSSSHPEGAVTARMRQSVQPIELVPCFAGAERRAISLEFRETVRGRTCRTARLHLYLLPVICAELGRHRGLLAANLG